MQDLYFEYIYLMLIRKCLNLIDLEELKLREKVLREPDPVP